MSARVRQVIEVDELRGRGIDGDDKLLRRGEAEMPKTSCLDCGCPSKDRLCNDCFHVAKL